MSTILIAITVLAMQSPGITVTTTQFSNQQSCLTTMTAMTEGAGAIFRANVLAISGEVLIKKEDGWMLVLSGMKREIARFKCVES